MITFTGTTVQIAETGESMKVKDPKVRDFFKKCIDHETKESNMAQNRGVEEGIRIGINKVKVRIINAMKGV